MTSMLKSSLRINWVRNGAYLARLVGDLDDDGVRWVAQPVDGRAMNHAAWILCHLSLYRRVILDLLRGTPFDDPFDAPFGRGSTVSAEAAAHPTPREMRGTIERLGIDALAALDAAPEERFEAPNPLARWSAMHPRVGEQLVTLMVKHESFHLGQLSAWRRALGLPSVPM